MADSWNGEGFDKPARDARKRYFAILKDLNITRSKEQEQEFLSVLLHKSFESRSELGDADWEIAANHMQQVQEQEKTRNVTR